MNIKYLTHEQIDKARWDLCVRQARESKIYACSWYLDVVSPGWDALVEEDYQAVFPLTWRKKLNIKYLYQPPFTQQLGLFTIDPHAATQVDRFLECIPPHFKLIDIQLHASNKPTHPAYNTRLRTNLVLGLSDQYLHLATAYSQNLRRNLGKAARYGWLQVPDLQVSQLISLFRENRGRNIQTLQAGDYTLLDPLLTACRQHAKVHVSGLAGPDGQARAGAIFLEGPGELIFLFSATDKLAKEHGAMSMLIDSMIRENSGRNLVLDFEGSEDLSLARFYGAFGARNHPYPLVQDRGLIRKLRDAVMAVSLVPAFKNTARRQG